ncbi:MAG: hypothetical protein JJU13_12405 [Balneolaceae bacterium]|nr:hypothetical protein [Balneolaceae bacterium]
MPEEIAIVRNSTEGLQICQQGFDFEPGDEVLTTNQDFPRMITTFQQLERRNCIKLRQISIPIPAEDEDEIILQLRNLTGFQMSYLKSLKMDFDKYRSG